MEFLLLAMIEQILLRQQDNLRKNVKQVFRHFAADVVELWSLREKKSSRWIEASQLSRLLPGCCFQGSGHWGKTPKAVFESLRDGDGSSGKPRKLEFVGQNINEEGAGEKINKRERINPGIYKDIRRTSTLAVLDGKTCLSKDGGRITKK